MTHLAEDEQNTAFLGRPGLLLMDCSLLKQEIKKHKVKSEKKKQFRANLELIYLPDSDPYIYIRNVYIQQKSKTS